MLKTIIKNFKLLFVSSMYSSLCGFICMLIIVNSLGFGQYGFYVLFLSITEISYKIINVQTWQVFIKEANENKETAAKVFNYCLVIDIVSLFITLSILIVFKVQIVDFFNVPEDYKNYIYVYIAVILTKVLDISIGLFRYCDRFDVHKKITIQTSTIKLILTFFVYVTFPSLLSYSLILLVVSFSAFFYKLYYIINSKEKLGFARAPFTIEGLKEVYGARINNLIWQIKLDMTIRVLSRQLDMVIISKLAGVESVGVYKVAKEISNIISRVTDPLYHTLFPEFAKSMQSGLNREVKQLINKMLMLFSLLASLSYIIYYFSGNYLISLFFYENEEFIYKCILMYIPAIGLSFVTLPLYPYFLSLGLSRFTMFNQIISTSIYLILLPCLTYYYGVLGAALSYSLYYLIWSSFSIFKYLNLKV